LSKFHFVSNFAYSTKFKAQKIKFTAQGIVIWCHFGQKSLEKAAAFEASKRGDKIAYSIRDDDKAVLYAVSKLFL